MRASIDSFGQVRDLEMQTLRLAEQSGSLQERWMQVFFGVAACSWVPHWSCHYYRLETGSGFAVGSWQFSWLDSWFFMLVYCFLITSNLVSIVVAQARWITATVSGALHIVLGALHAYRIVAPFRFEVFGYPWSQGASIREAGLVLAFGVLCLWVAGRAAVSSTK